ncbi:MAG: hypothetical protein WD576_02340 [Nitriliruptoraceae bacterium]
MTDTIVVPLDLRRVDVTGTDRISYLDDVTTQQFADAPIGALLPSLYLDIHGAPQAMFDAVVLGDRVSLIAEPGVATTLVNVLGGRTFLLDATFTIVDDAAIAVRGPAANDILAAAGFGRVAGRCRVADDVLIVDRSCANADGVYDGADLVGPRATLAEIVDELSRRGARQAGVSEIEDRRVHAGVPRWGCEVVAPHLPEEAGVLPTHVHLAKGCYPGQEAVARMWMLGRPRRRLAQVHITANAGSDPAVPRAGDQIGSGRQSVVFTSVAASGDVALAYVPPDATEGAVVHVSDGQAFDVEVRRIIGDDPQPPGHDPAMVRRRDRRAA